MSQYDYDTKEQDFSLGLDEFRWNGKVWKDLELLDGLGNVYHPNYGFGSVMKQKGYNVRLFDIGEDCCNEYSIDEIKTERYGHLLESMKHLKKAFRDQPETMNLALGALQALIATEPNDGGFSVNEKEQHSKKVVTALNKILNQTSTSEVNN
jgi:hypothetical protein